jgi:hypothetical protein
MANFRVDPEPYTEPDSPPRANPAILLVVAASALFWILFFIVLLSFID